MSKPQNRKPQTVAQKTATPAASPAPAVPAPAPVQSPAAPAPVTTRLSPVPAAQPRTLADVLAEIDKVTEAASLARKVGFKDIAVEADKRLTALHAEKASLSPAPAPVRQSAAVVETVVPAAPSAVSAPQSVGLVVAEVKDGNGRLLGVITVPQKDFKTGSRGYYANAKIEIGGKRYQTQIQLVEIGSKPAADSDSK